MDSTDSIDIDTLHNNTVIPTYSLLDILDIETCDGAEGEAEQYVDICGIISKSVLAKNNDSSSSAGRSDSAGTVKVNTNK